MNDSIFRRPWAAAVLLTAVCGTAYAQGQNPLPAPWQQTDVGDVGLAGSAYVSNDGDLVINGAGSDIWGSADSFHFVYERIEDGDISSEYPSQDATNPYAKVGLMIRLTTDPGSPHVVLDVKPNGEIEFMTRQAQGGPTTWIAGSTAGGALKLVRSGGTVTGIVCPFNSNTCQTLGSVNFPPGMALTGAIITSHDPTVLNHGGFAANLPTVNTIPATWSSYDVGDVGVRGAAFFESPGDFTVEGAGADIWGTSDSYHFVSTAMNGSGFIMTHVVSESASDTFAKAGLVITSGPLGSGPTVILDVRPNGQIEFMARTAAGGQMQFIAGMQSQFELWLKIERDVNSFSGFTSRDGVNWTFVGSIDVSMSTDAGAGLAVTSHDRTVLNTATFTQTTLTSEGLNDIDIGDVGAAGWHGTANGHEVVNGSGADIWGTADAFNYYYTDLINDGSMAVRILSLDNTSTWAKAGLMIRATADPSSPHVIVDVKPDGSIEFMTRSTAGASTTYITGVAPEAFPLYLQLRRSGSNVTAYISNSTGAPTLSLGPVSIDLPSHAMIGIAVTSHSRGTLAQAAVDAISH